MSDDVTKPSMPAQPTTVQLPAVPEWAIELTKSVKGGFAELRADIGLVSNDLSIVKDRVGIIETWKNDQDARTSRTSAGVRSLSTTDAEQAAQLAQERAAREALAREVADLKTTNGLQLTILTRLDTITQKPVVKTLAAMLATAAITWLAAHGVHLQ